MTLKTQPTVFVVDDDDAVRKTLQLLMQSVSLKVETYPSAEEFLAAYTPERAGCLVLDVRMRGMSGPTLQEHLNKQGAQIPIIIITGHGDVPMAVEAMRKGALDFIEKPFREQVLLERVRSALARDARHRHQAAERAVIEERIKLLTPREREVMELVVEGKSTKQIAAQFEVSNQAVDAHRARIMKKMQTDSVAELVRLALLAK